MKSLLANVPQLPISALQGKPLLLVFNPFFQRYFMHIQVNKIYYSLIALFLICLDSLVLLRGRKCKCFPASFPYLRRKGMTSSVL